MSNFGVNDYLGLTVTYDGSNRPTYCAYFSDTSKTILLNEYTIGYTVDDQPIFLGEILYDHQWNIGHAEFELKVSLDPSIIAVNFNPLAAGVVSTGVNQFNIPWTLATGVNIGEYLPIGGTAPFTYTITSDPDSKFLLVDEFLQLSTNLNIFVDTEHTVTVEVEDDNSKVFEILLTFTVVSGTFTNTYSMNFLDTTSQSMITSLPSADATTQFTISIWYNTSTNNRAFGGRWDNSTDCHWYLGFDSARPRLWVSGDGSNTIGANVQSMRTTVTHTSGTWEQLVVTFNAGTINMYVDALLDNGTTAGTPQASMFSSATQSMELSVLAGGNPGNDGIWDGLMDEFSFWNVEFTAAQVTEIYNGGEPGDLSAHSAAANLQDWYFLGDAATATGCPEVTSNGANELLFANGMVLADRSTNIPP